MSGFDTARLDALARRLGLAPRQLALAAARLARDESADAQRRRAVLAAARVPTAAMEHVASLMTTPIAGFALDEVDRALAALFLGPPAANASAGSPGCIDKPAAGRGRSDGPSPRAEGG